MSTKPSLTWLQMLILQTAADDRDGLVRPNGSVPEMVYRSLWCLHGCLEEGPGMHFRITEKGRSQVAHFATMQRRLRRAA